MFNDYASMPGYVQDALKGWEDKASRVSAWWQAYKRKLVYRIHEDIVEVGGVEVSEVIAGRWGDSVTVVMPTSPIRLHPSLAIIEETVESVRAKLGERVEIIVMVDGIEGQNRDYSKYVGDLMWKCNHEWTNVLPVIFDKKSQQATMTYAVLDLVKTPLLLFVEHDAPLCGEFDWDGLIRVCVEGDANVVRFHQV